MGKVLTLSPFSRGFFLGNWAVKEEEEEEEKEEFYWSLNRARAKRERERQTDRQTDRQRKSVATFVSFDF